ncbi:MAG: helix-turn-helix transcriptional regulator [Clostridia bacterium]|nr:helix-turn-helix transcriptional regulator [Clostridia bacterium]
MNYAKILKEIRTERGLTQVELAKLANLAPSCIAMIEVGKNEPTANTLICLSQALNVSVDYLVGREDDFGVINQTGNSLTSIQQELLFSFNLLDRDKQQQVIGFCKALNY